MFILVWISCMFCASVFYKYCNFEGYSRRIRELLEKLPNNIMKDENQLECTICLQNMWTNDINSIKTKKVSENAIKSLPCGHIFHLKCIEQWLCKSPINTCPQCRKSPFSEAEHQLWMMYSTRNEELL